MRIITAALAAALAGGAPAAWGAEADGAAPAGQTAPLTARITNGTGFTVYARGAGATEAVIPPGGQKDVVGMSSPSLVLQTLAAPATVDNKVEVAASGGAADGILGRLSVVNAAGKRLELRVDGVSTASVEAGGAFVQDLGAGTYTVGVYDADAQRSLLERTFAVRDGIALTWTVGAAGTTDTGWLLVGNPSGVPLQISLNGADRGRVLPGTERVLSQIKAEGPPPPVAPAPVIEAGPLWGDEPAAPAPTMATAAATSPGAPAPAAPQEASTAPEPAAAPAPITTAVEPVAAPPVATVQADKAPTGTLRVGNQTDRRLKVYVNGAEAGWVEPGAVLELKDQALGEYDVEAEDARAGAFVRAHLTLQRGGQIVQWNATGWY